MDIERAMIAQQKLEELYALTKGDSVVVTAAYRHYEHIVPIKAKT